MMQEAIPRRLAGSVLQSLTAGVVPRVGLQYVNAGRKEEISALLSDLETVAEGGAACRFIVGKYGSGKSFLLGLLRNLALEKGFVVCDCDLSPERRFAGSKGQGLATYRELMHNLSVKTRPDGGALSLILERWLSSLMLQAAEEHPGAEDALLQKETEHAVLQAVSKLEGMVFYFDFYKVIRHYLQGYFAGDEEAKSASLRWLRGEYDTKTEARKELGVSAIISDDNFYDCLKLMASFVLQAGYRGLIVQLDELVNLYKIVQSVTRKNNYEKLLTVFNDTLQGKASHIGFYFCATPEMMDDQRRGIASYEALRSRLSSARMVREDLRDLTGPVIRLHMLSNEELFVLSENLLALHASYYHMEKALSQEELTAFLQMEFARIGADKLLTPREITRDLLELLNLLQQHPEETPQQLLAQGFSFAKPAFEGEGEIPPEFADLTLD